MNYGILQFLTLIGSLGLFLYGMKLLSESLQKVAGDRMRAILSVMTSNRAKGIFTGLIITAIIQSSSATTVMIVSFVNAGLLSLVQSVGVIMGANIGTTFTAWIISLLGFKFQISTIAMPLIGFGVPLLFSKRQARRSWGELIVGFALLFMGLDFLKDSVPNISEHPQILSFLTEYTSHGYLSILLFWGIGTVLTIIIQSSSATMALTLVMCSNGWISYELAAAMVLGENLGTTITANLAASVANVAAKRAARIHFLFNLIGIAWMLVFIRPYIAAIDSGLVYLGADSPSQIPSGIPIALSTFHTTFNIINVLALVWFTPVLVKIAEKLVKQHDDEEVEYRLQHISIGLLSTAELSLLQAKKEIITYAKRTYRMYTFVKDLFHEDSDATFFTTFERIEKYESISDRVELEIATYLSKISGSELSEESAKRLQAMFRIISEIESIADSSYSLARILRRKMNAKIWFNQDVRDNVDHMLSLVDRAIVIMIENLQVDHIKINLGPAYEAEEEINQSRNRLRNEHINNVEANRYKYQAGVIYSDIFNEAEKMGDYVINVSESIAEINKPLIKPATKPD